MAASTKTAKAEVVVTTAAYAMTMTTVSNETMAAAIISKQTEE
jgi:hypothetical protein